MADYAVTRSIAIDAPPERILPLITSFPEWRRWSPWEGIDPELRREYRGPSDGVGAVYEYRGNRRAGAGIMTVTAVDPDGASVHLQFLKPFRSESDHRFELVPGDGGTTVSWTMRGRQNAIMKRLMSLEKFIGPDFEKGLAALKAAAEG